MSDQTNQEAKGTGVNLRPGDRFYIPAGGLKIRIKEDGTTGLSVSVAVDPWLPDMSANEVTSVETMEAITKNGFPVSSVCGTLYRPRVLGQWFDGIRIYAAASSPTRSRRTCAGLR